MAIQPETKYVQSGDISIAYQVAGNGPLDLVIIPGFVSHLEQPGKIRRMLGFCNGCKPANRRYPLSLSSKEG